MKTKQEFESAFTDLYSRCNENSSQRRELERKIYAIEHLLVVKGLVTPEELEASYEGKYDRISVLKKQ